MRYYFLVWVLTFLIYGCSTSNDKLAQAITLYENHEKTFKTPQDFWPIQSDSLREAKISSLSQISEVLNNIPLVGLTEEQQINTDLLRIVVDDELYSMQTGIHKMPLNAEGGFITGIIYSTRNVRLEKEEDYERFFKRLRGLPEYIEHQISNMKQGIADGMAHPAVVVHNCSSILQDQIREKGKVSFLTTAIGSLPDNKKEEAEKMISEDVYPALLQLHQFLTSEYATQVRSSPGIHAIKGGEDYYRQRVKYYTTLDMSPEEVYETGEREVERILQEMQSILDSIQFRGSIQEFIFWLRNEPRFYARTPQEILDKAAWLSKKAEEFLPRYFGKLPRLPFTVNPVPEAIAPTYTSGRYSGGSMDQKRAGQYWVNTFKLESRPLYALPALTLHEAVPGHHLQISLAQELEGLPPFRKTYLSAYGEGWGLYSEYLGKEAGMYEDPYDDFGRLTYEMWRACRLVVDVGIHYKGWTREEAIQYMADRTALSMHEVTTEIDRYIGWPAQAVSYKIGELKIRELRKRAEEKLGDGFDIRSFHDKVLENGSIPLLILERIIDGFIEDEQKRIQLENDK